jgi:hypothetical protein
MASPCPGSGSELRREATELPACGSPSMEGSVGCRPRKTAVHAGPPSTQDRRLAGSHSGFTRDAWVWDLAGMEVPKGKG